MIDDQIIEELIKYFNKDDSPEDNDTLDALKELKYLRKKTSWIPINYQHPEINGDYLIWDKKNKRILSYHLEYPYTPLGEEISHWMPIPEPPEMKIIENETESNKGYKSEHIIVGNGFISLKINNYNDRRILAAILAEAGYESIIKCVKNKLGFENDYYVQIKNNYE